MKKALLCLLLTAVLLGSLLPAALAVDNGADPLTWAEVVSWAGELELLAREQEPLNDPHAEEAYSEDGYAFVYDFGTLYYDRPELTEDSVLRGAVVLGEETPGPRGTNTLMMASQLLDAFYTENEALVGTRESAILYLSGSLPEGVWFGRVLRDGQWLDTVQYTAHEQREDGLYTDGGLVYTLQGNSVVAIRVYGLDSAMTQEEVEAEMLALQPELTAASYAMVPSSPNGAENPMFAEDDLLVLGMDLRTCTPETAILALGEPEADEELPDENGARMRVMSFNGCTLVFLQEAMAGAPRLAVLTIDREDLEGPRAMRVGDSLNMVLQRFRSGEGELNGLTEVLYGTPGEGSWGDAVYEADASAAVRYGLTLADGRKVVLAGYFEMLTLTEINITFTN